MSLSTRQFFCLDEIAKATDQNRGSTKPSGPTGRPMKNLEAAGLIAKDEHGFYRITEQGRATLHVAKNGKDSL